jgi:two-component system heavy metal sensor histidine kinase CusS
VSRTSLRWRIALGTSALAGGVLMGFALLSSWLIYQAKIDRLDAQIESALMRVGRFPPINPPSRPEATLAQALGVSDDTTIALQLLDANGSVIYQSNYWPETLQPTLPSRSPDHAAPPSPAEDWGRSRRRPAAIVLRTQRTPGGRWRVGTILVPRGRGTLAVSLTTIRSEMAMIRRIYLITIPGALVLIAGGAWGLSGRSLQPIHQLSRTINQVTAQGLDQRVSVQEIDQEFEPLIQSFNAMLERLERSFHQASRFSGDAAHELKTPLTILQGELERAIHQADTGSPMQQTLNHLLEEVRRLKDIVRKLLLLSLADAGQIALKRDPVNLNLLLTEQLEDVALLAPELKVDCDLEDNLVAGCDRALMTQVMQNLLSNAIKYNQPQGWIHIQGHRQAQGIALTVANPSRTLTAEERAQLFDRFYRGDLAHTRQTDGLGLGLSLSREILKAHGGDLQLEDSPSHEVRFKLWLPNS